MVSDLKSELTSLKIDRSRKEAISWRGPLLLLAPAILLLGTF